MILTIGAVVIALSLVLVVAAAAQLHLERKRLVALADLLALEAADAVPDERYYGAEQDERITLTDASVRAAVDAYLDEHPAEADHWRAFAVVDAEATDALTATVRLEARVYPSSVAWVLAPWSDGIVLQAEASATAA
ncbi:hypothetical protein KIN34_14535 [Cellulomonas sp. DKR-3]|uniref:Flp pilus-assembly TadG-like N-terminal domain-containing protein n=1 Tax=Cellulomonas fulva TaxID=2835530 RepID=A0ABS5U289_9CELL|nr:hypothetical protein [Cellulomonas fulva]MBT0995500.1 hypothetical protein [Cellulomonas fulva]